MATQFPALNCLFSLTVGISRTAGQWTCSVCLGQFDGHMTLFSSATRKQSGILIVDM